ncbi:hypothetical protein Tco_0466645 [Tanacetum coccineum]
MRPRRLLRLLSDFDCKIRYHPGKASVAADALSINERAKPLKLPQWPVMEEGITTYVSKCLMFKDEERSSEAIWFTGTTRNTSLEMGKCSHGFHRKTTRENKQYDTIWVIEIIKKRIMLTILVKVGAVTYRPEPPEQLSRTHSTFHVSNLKEYLSNETLAIQLDEIQIDNTLYPIEEPIEIVNHEVKRLKQSSIPNVKVRWSFRRGPEYT